jgi:thiamine monophosphate synthase
MHDETLEEAASSLSEVRRMFDAAREALESGPDDSQLREAAVKLKRMAAEVERIEKLCGRPVPAARG